MSELIHDPLFIYTVAFVVFAILAYVYGRKPLLGWLDAGIAEIRAELDEARRLRAEAETALADCKTKQAAAESDAKAIISRAQEQAELMRRKAADDLEASLKRQEQIAAERIRLAEAEAVADVRRAAIDMAMTMARKALAENMPEADAARLVDQAIGDVSALKKTAPKAA
ncbi:MAG: F0F1 ATP synthase subunit B [Alphaproteobacteria bacterium]|nr:F0F1 ATP synthase subunit B [Alphaproteobacteria bacterium]